jgi:putative transposase
VVIAPDGSLRKAYLLSQIDAATRFVPHSYFALSENAVHQEYGLQQAILKHGPPRTYYVDLGAAYIAHSLQLICAELDIRLLHTQVQDCEAKGVIERWHRTWREEVGDELPDQPLPLAELNAKHWSWLAAEYHARQHSTTGRVPREHWLAELPFLRSLPRQKNLSDVFLHRERRVVRKDGTVRFRGAIGKCAPNSWGRKWNCASIPTTKRRAHASSSKIPSFATPCRWTVWPTLRAGGAACVAKPPPTPSPAAWTHWL